MKTSHFVALQSAIDDTLERVHRTIPGLIDHYENEGLTPMRMRWDLYWAANHYHGMNQILCKYLQDDHIDTALRLIVSGRR